MVERALLLVGEADLRARAAAGNGGGERGHDLAVRLKYAGVPSTRIDACAAGKPLAAALDHIVSQTDTGNQIFLLLTYTALLQLRQSLADRGAVAEFWEQ